MAKSIVAEAESTVKKNNKKKLCNLNPIIMLEYAKWLSNMKDKYLTTTTTIIITNFFVLYINLPSIMVTNINTKMLTVIITTSF